MDGLRHFQQHEHAIYTCLNSCLLNAFLFSILLYIQRNEFYISQNLHVRIWILCYHRICTCMDMNFMYDRRFVYLVITVDVCMYNWFGFIIGLGLSPEYLSARGISVSDLHPASTLASTEFPFSIDGKFIRLTIRIVYTQPVRHICDAGGIYQKPSSMEAH